MSGLHFNTVQMIFFWGLICMVLGIVLSLIVLTVVLMRVKPSLTPRQVGKWLLGFAMGLCFCYFMLIVTG